MANFYVSQSSGNDSNNGSTGSPWRTLGKAYADSNPSDTILVRNGTYKESLLLSKANQTWKNDAGHSPIIEGPYPPSRQGDYIADGKNKGQVSLRANGITIDGFFIRYVDGNGVTGTGCSGATVKNCRFDFTYISSIKIAPDSFVDDVLVENNVCTRAGMQSFAPTPPDESGNDPGGGVIKMGRCRDGTCRGNVCCLSYGEGINIGKGNVGFILENNTIFLVSHKHIYVNRSTDVIVRGNVAWYKPGHPDIDSGNPVAPAAIGVGDECGKIAPGGACENDLSWPSSARVIFYNNLVVGLGELFYVANGGRYNTHLDDCYVGFNTFVGGPMTTKSGVDIGENRRNQPHKRCIFENNVIDMRFAPSGTKLHTPGPTTGWGLRNNVWSGTPETTHRGPGDSYGNPQLANANAAIALIGAFPQTTSTFARTNYALTNNSTGALNNAASGAFNGLTPPVVNIDILGATRPFPVGGVRDRGSFEYGGTVSGFIANFTQNGSSADTAIGGDAPFTVAFAYTGNGTPNYYRWDFGDGNIDEASGASVSHTYVNAGTYNVNLLARNAVSQQSNKSGANITVSTSGGGGGTAIADVARVALRSGTGLQNFTIPGLGITPKAALLVASKAIADGVDASGILYSVGAVVAGNQQWSNAIASLNGGNSGLTKTNRLRTSRGCLVSIDENGAQTGLLEFDGWIPDGLRGNVSDAFPAQYLTSLVYFGGSQVEAAAGTTMMAGADIGKRVTLAYHPDLIIASAVGIPEENTPDNHAFMSNGFCLADGTQFFRTWSVESGLSPTVARLSPNDIAVVQFRGGRDVITPGKNKVAIAVSDISGTGFTLTPLVNSAAAPVHWLALRLPGLFLSLSDILTPLSTSDQYLLSEGGQPIQLLLQLLSLATSSGTDEPITSPLSGVYGFYARGNNGQFSTVVTTKVGEPVSIDKSRSDDRLVIPDHAGEGPVVAGSVALTPTGPAATLTHTGTVPYYQPTLMIGTAATSMGPTADFSAAPRAGVDHLQVTFSNLSNLGGLAATYLWDFGDGFTSTEIAPVHDYEEPGSFAVSLTVTTSAGSDIETKPNYINIVAIPDDPDKWLLLYLPLTATNYTVNKLQSNKNLPNYGRLEIAIDLDALYIDDDGDDVEAVFKSGKVRLGWNNAKKQIGVRQGGQTRRIIPTLNALDWYIDHATNEVIYQKPDGTLRKIATAAVSGGGGSGGDPVTIIVPVGHIDHDGYQKADGTVVLAETGGIPLTAPGRYGILYWPLITIPAGRIIQEATIKLLTYDAASSSPNALTIHWQNSINPTAPQAVTGNVSSRSLTAGIAWPGENLPVGSITSPNLAANLQTVVNLAGRPTTFPLVAVFDAATLTNLSFRPAGHSSNQPPELRIVHVAP